MVSPGACFRLGHFDLRGGRPVRFFFLLARLSLGIPSLRVYMKTPILDSLGTPTQRRAGCSYYRASFLTGPARAEYSLRLVLSTGHSQSVKLIPKGEEERASECPADDDTTGSVARAECHVHLFDCERLRSSADSLSCALFFGAGYFRTDRQLLER